MTIAEFKKVARLLKEAYKEVEKSAIEHGISPISADYEKAISKTRIEVLSKLGFNLDEYIQAKDQNSGISTTEVYDAVTKLDTRLSKIEETPIPTAEEVMAVAHHVAKQYIKPPQITHQIVKETTVEKPKIIKEIITPDPKLLDNLKSDIFILQSSHGELQKFVETMPKVNDEWIKKSESLKDAIKIVNSKAEEMPDFRKLAMGLRGDIDSNITRIKALETNPSGGGSWGSITGTLSNQTDLQTALNAKQNSLGFTAVPNTRTVNGHALSADVTVSQTDVGLENVVNLDTSTTANITDSSNKRFVTDAQRTVIGNTSGTNTGDQTNISGNAATVTTNANLTGVITSVGNTTSIASQTGTGTKFVTDTSPTLVTPILGVATVTSLAAATNSSISMLSGTFNTIQTYTPSAAGTATLDLSKGNIHHITMPAGNITIALSNGTAGQCFIIRILQDSSGSRTVTWFTTIRWSGGSAPTLTTTANKVDTFGFEVTGSSTYDAFVIGQNI